MNYEGKCNGKNPGEKEIMNVVLKAGMQKKEFCRYNESEKISCRTRVERIYQRFLSAKGELTLAMKCMSMCSSFVIIYFFLIHVRLHII